ncbi:hypothetical protein DFJ43DRAFT_1135264 [Lentinula guzmanii]|uniref:ribonuclease H n=1 Tax=Lentinula guzmanii TaxID=2804957 RepID=A0AA38MQ99_9AGAR|nr:hypothetical protein DFJ43DRAFT_1135264 [Lentinula guzmanii]
MGSVADALIALHTPESERGIEESIKVNIFLQSWKTKRRDLPKDLQNLLKVSAKYGVRLEGLAFSRDILREMPIWYHIESNPIRNLNRGKESSCLKENHRVRTVGDTEKLARMKGTPRHNNRRDCRCTSCTELRSSAKCKAPNRCINRANQLLETLPQKWNPCNRLPEDFEPHESWHPGAEKERTLSDAFRIFTDGRKCNTTADMSWMSETQGETITVYTDGSCENNGGEDAVAGAGIFVRDNNPLNRAIRIPNELVQSNQTGEIISIKEIAEAAPPSTGLDILSDSLTMVEGLTRNLREWEEKGSQTSRITLNYK